MLPSAEPAGLPSNQAAEQLSNRAAELPSCRATKNQNQNYLGLPTLLRVLNENREEYSICLSPSHCKTSAACSQTVGS